MDDERTGGTLTLAEYGWRAGDNADAAILSDPGVRWSRFTGQFGGKAKMDFKFDYAASFSSFSCVA